MMVKRSTKRTFSDEITKFKISDPEFYDFLKREEVDIFENSQEGNVNYEGKFNILYTLIETNCCVKNNTIWRFIF